MTESKFKLLEKMVMFSKEIYMQKNTATNKRTMDINGHLNISQ